MMIYPTHFHQSVDEATEIQTVPEYIQNMAEIVSARLCSVYLTKVGYLVGLLHDQRKFLVAFREYMEKLMAGKPMRRGSVIHAHAAARFLLERYHTGGGFDSYCDM